MYFPGCLFVIFGREKLRWEQEWNEYIEMCELRNLETAYSYEYLLSAGIKEEAILDKIVESCQGYPFYLSLALKTYADIVNSGRTPNNPISDLIILRSSRDLQIIFQATWSY